MDDGENNLISKSHAESIMLRMDSYFNQNQFCDVTLLVGNRRIPAHKIVLASASDYFAAMFSNDVIEAHLDEIVIKGMDEESLEALVKYMYLGRLDISEDTVESLMSTSCILQLGPVIEACSTFLIRQLHSSNCIGIRLFGERHGCQPLITISFKYILENFLEVIENSEYLALLPDFLEKILLSDNLNVANEEMVFHALVNWFNHDYESRKVYLSRLLSTIRLSLLTPQFLVDHVCNNVLFKKDLACVDLMMAAMQYHLLPERRSQMVLETMRPRKATLGFLYAVGGMDCSKGATSIERYDYCRNTWTQHTNMSGRRLQFGIALIEGCLYVVGGRDGLKTLNTVESYSPKTKQWSLVTPMSTHRHGLGVAVLEGPMYAVGGHDGWSYLSTVERWDPQARQWCYVASMTTPRSTVGVCALANKLYAVGGRDGTSCLRSVECFDPHTNKWSLCSPMNKRRGGVGVAAYNGFLYAIGGHDAPSCQPTSSRFECCERYDPKTDTWTLVASLSSPRDAVGICLLGDKLFAVGGYNGQQYLNNVESYDPITNVWTEMAPLCIGRAGACIIQIPNS